jgi:hypothetical protein
MHGIPPATASDRFVPVLNNKAVLDKETGPRSLRFIGERVRQRATIIALSMGGIDALCSRIETTNIGSNGFVQLLLSEIIPRFTAMPSFSIL